MKLLPRDQGCSGEPAVRGKLGKHSSHPPHPTYPCGLRLAARVAVHRMNGFEDDLLLLARTASQSLASGVMYIQGREDL